MPSATPSFTATATSLVPEIPGGGTSDVYTGSLAVNGVVQINSYNACVGPYGNGNSGPAAPAVQTALSPYPTPPGLLSSGSLTVNSGQTLNLAAGNYLYDNVVVNTAGTVQGTGGLVRIWVSGQWTLNSGAKVLGADNLPANLWVFLEQGAGPVVLDSGTTFTGVLYGPSAQITVNSDAVLFGGLVGGQVMIDGGAQVHLDLGLGGCGNGASAALRIAQAPEKQGSPLPEMPIGGLDFVMAPNPAVDHEVVFVRLPQPETIALALYTIVGAKVLSLSLGRQAAGQVTTTLDLRSLASGIYFAVLEAKDDFGNTNHRIFKLAVQK